MKAIDYYKSKIDNFVELSFEDRRHQLKCQCLDKDKMHTKATLKGLFRLKPASDAKPCGSYTNDFKKEINLYYAIDCVPMRNVSSKPRTKAQAQATKKLITENFKKSPTGKAVDLCKRLIAEKAVVIDTETTDLNGVAIQIAVVCCASKEVLYSSLIATDKPISPEAYNIHGISKEMLIGAPSPEQVAFDLQKVIMDKTLVAYNARFDKEICQNTFGSQPWIDNKTVCAMYGIAVPVLGSTNRHGTISLTNAMAFANVKWRGQAHDASADALATADLIAEIATLQSSI